MKKFFNPSSVAVFGVSPAPGNLAALILENLREMEFQGKVYGIGTKACTVSGYPVLTTMKEIPHPIDVVSVLTPAQTVPDIFRDCGELGIRRIVVLTGGFNEFGGEGARLSQEIVEIADAYGIKFIGPNCQGLIDFHTGTCLSFGLLRRHQIKKGRVAIISQSGSVGWLTSLLLSHEIGGLSKVMSIGNKLSVDEVQLTEYLMEDDHTDIILFYLESLKDGRRLCELAMQSEKPFVILKANRGSGSQLALSHTAALASNDRVVDAAFNEAGIIRAQTYGELLDWAKALSGPPIKGPNVVAMITSGGMALMCEDACRNSGLNLIELPTHVKEKLWEIGRPKIINHTNPIDLGNVFNNQEIYVLLRMVLAWEETDAVVFSLFDMGKAIHGDLDTVELIRMAFDAASRAGKPMAFFWVNEPDEVFELKQKTAFPIYGTMEDAVESLRKKLLYTTAKSHKSRTLSHRPVCLDLDRAGQIISSTTDYYLDDVETMELLAYYGINRLKLRVVRSLEELGETAREIGYPLVMKIHAREIFHKSDVDGVRLGIKDFESACQCYAEMTDTFKKAGSGAPVPAVKLQKMASEGIDVIVGGKRDKDFGAVLMVGLGGIYAEVFDDVAFRMAPVSNEDCLEMLKRLKSYKLFGGFRSGRPYDLDGLADIVMKFSNLLVDFPQIDEADLNPVRVYSDGTGASVLDARIFLEK
ncbi:MAG: acetate--CoA ligase family protein [Desulfobacteraceae bacterium]|jgi:acetyltransferase